MDPRFWSIVFTVLMICGIFLEMLTPSLHAFTIVAMGFGVASAWMGFRYSESFGWLMTGIDLALFPISLYIGIGFLQRSPLMHRSEIASSTQNSPDALPLTELVGMEGKSLTPLRPAGAAQVGTRRIDVVTEGKFVAADTPIKVIQVEGNRIIVEPIEKKVST